MCSVYAILGQPSYLPIMYMCLFVCLNVFSSADYTLEGWNVIFMNISKQSQQIRNMSSKNQPNKKKNNLFKKKLYMFNYIRVISIVTLNKSRYMYFKTDQCALE